MTDALTFKKHIFGHAVGAWGHNKPLITLAVLISELRKDIAFTILTNPTMYPKIMGELGKLPRERLKPIEMQINVLQVVPPHPDPFYSAPEIGIEFKKLYEQNGVVTCLASGKTIDCAYFPRPSVAIIDPFAEYALDGIRAYASPEEVPIISWMTGSAGPLLSMWGPEKYGGKGDVVSKLKEEMQNSGKSELEAFYSENVFGTTDKVVQIPGFPPFYDYERVTQPMNDEFKGLNMHAVLNGSRFMAKSEAIIAISSSVLEGEAVEACRELFSSMGKSFFAIGPMPTIPAPEKVGENNTETARVVSFLDEMHSRFGDKSVLYISFGTFFWPPDGATFRVLVDELVESKTPFILAHPSPLFRPEESLLESIRACPTAIEVPWAPQERILTHEATGWFLTHGGWNSIQEALLYKVPLIMWPMGADQPLNALLLSEKFKVAIELLEVRESSNSRRPYRLRDQPHSESPKDEFKRVLSDIKGEKGALIRNNLESLSKKVGGVWGREGEARRELDAFLNKMGIEGVLEHITECDVSESGAKLLAVVAASSGRRPGDVDGGVVAKELFEGTWP